MAGTLAALLAPALMLSRRKHCAVFGMLRPAMLASSMLIMLQAAAQQQAASIAGFPVLSQGNTLKAARGTSTYQHHSDSGEVMAMLESAPQNRTGAANAPTGLFPLGLGPPGGRDGYLFVPQSYKPGVASSFMLALHDAGSNATQPLQLLLAAANSSGIIVLAPDSRHSTWDLTSPDTQSFGVDIDFIDQALNSTFALYNVNASRVAVEGFSDGATYALSIGITNCQHLFRQIIAFSPGGVASTSMPSTPPFVYVTVGTQDTLFPASYIVGQLIPFLSQVLRIPVTLNEGPWGHAVPQAVANTAMSWLYNTSSLAPHRLPPVAAPPRPTGRRLLLRS